MSLSSHSRQKPSLASLLSCTRLAPRAPHMKEPPLGPDGKRLIKRLAASFAECSEDARRYGACVKAQLEAVQQGACEKEFVKLQRCFRASIAKARARGQ